MKPRYYRIEKDEGWQIYKPNGVPLAIAKDKESANLICEALDALNSNGQMNLSEAAKELGRRGGLKGGKERARRYCKEALSAMGTHAAEARWGKKAREEREAKWKEEDESA